MGNTRLAVLQALSIVSTQSLVHTFQAKDTQEPFEASTASPDALPDALSDINSEIIGNHTWVPLRPPDALPPKPTNPSLEVVMEPGGVYGQHAASQLAYLSMLKDRILEDVKEGAVIYDFGCADAINNVDLLRRLKFMAKNYTVGFVDLPENDWKTTSEVLKPYVDEIVPDYETHNETQLSAVFRHAGSKGLLIPKSFYTQVAPDQSVNIAFSSSSVHYLSDNSQASSQADRAHQAALDWTNFLWNRGKELAPGGALHVTGLATYMPGTMTGHLWVVMSRVLKEAVFTAIITEAQRREWRWPGYPRTFLEWMTPFFKKVYLLGDNECQLELESFEMVTKVSPYWDMAKSNPYEFGRLYVPSIMAWMGPYLTKSLESRVRDLFEFRLLQEVQSFPYLFKQDLMQAVMTIRKKPVPSSIDPFRFPD